MKVFLSWSGKRSKYTAGVLCEWLPQVIQAVEPWTSSEIEKGARWGLEITEKLEQSKVGIICLTRENLNEPWILFEAGALSKTKDAYVCTFLLDLRPTDIVQPLAQFQATQFKKEDVRKLLDTINQILIRTGEHSVPEWILSNAFDTYWPRLEKKIQEIVKRKPEIEEPARSVPEMVKEILETVRALEKLSVIEKRFQDPEKTIREFKEIIESAILEQKRE